MIEHPVWIIERFCWQYHHALNSVLVPTNWIDCRSFVYLVSQAKLLLTTRICIKFSKAHFTLARPFSSFVWRKKGYSSKMWCFTKSPRDHIPGDSNRVNLSSYNSFFFVLFFSFGTAGIGFMMRPTICRSSPKLFEWNEALPSIHVRRCLFPFLRNTN